MNKGSHTQKRFHITTKKQNKVFHILAQIFLPTLTLGGQFVTAMKFPEYGLVLSLISQPFRLYSSWKAWKDAKQIGILITTIIFTLITTRGVINYRFL